MPKPVTISYRVSKVCKHSVRMTPNLVIKGETLPDIYITNDLFTRMEFQPGSSTLVDITFQIADTN